MPQTIIRRVLVNERDFKRMKQQCLVVSSYGNKNLYDTCEWRPVTKHDLLLYLIKIPTAKHAFTTYIAHHRSQWYDLNYLYDYEFQLNSDDVLIGRRKHTRYSYQFGWATVTKVKE